MQIEYGNEIVRKMKFDEPLPPETRELLVLAAEYNTLLRMYEKDMRRRKRKVVRKRVRTTVPTKRVRRAEDFFDL